MRITEAQEYTEYRDSIAKDWSRFFKTVLPGVCWMYLPNIGGDITDYIKSWSLNAFILSGGDDIGKYPLRDDTEFSVLDFAAEKALKVLGVCRGMQVMHKWLGGEVVGMTSQESLRHRAARHNIAWGNSVCTVNSYHTYKLSGAIKAVILASCVDDGSIEAIKYQNMLGLMWHPEREEILPSWQVSLINGFMLEKS